MPDENAPHLWIPSDHVTTERFEPSGFPPPFNRENHSEHGERLLASYQRVQNTVFSRPDASLTDELVLQIATPPDVPVKNQRSKLEQLGFEVVGYSARERNKATGIISKTAFNTLQTRLESYARRPGNPGKTNLAVLEELAEVPAEDKVSHELLSGDTDTREGCIISVYNRLPQTEKLAVAEAIARTLPGVAEGETTVREFSNGSVCVTASITPLQMLDIGANYITVRSISANADIVVTRAVPHTPLPTTIQVAPPVVATPVAVVDSGINDSCPLLKGLVTQRLSFLPAGATPSWEHGTFVASRVVYGDDLDRQISQPSIEPWCPIVDVVVIGEKNGASTKATEADMVGAIQQAVTQLSPTVRVFNISVGPPSRVASGEFSELAKMLDYLARAHDVLFVVAAGNIKTPASAPPTHFAHHTARIWIPSEALLALTVGSYARYADTDTLARLREVSPFTRAGPGADDGIKPEVVAHGGNVTATWETRPRIATYGIYGDGLQLASDIGTSFAAPLISQMAVRLHAAYDRASTNLVRALLCHFCDEVLAPDTCGCDPFHLRGFGEPVLKHAVVAQPHAATYLYEGELERETIQHIPFLVPSTLAPVDTRRRIRIRGTLVYDPPVNPDNSEEYSQCRIVAHLYKRHEVGFRRVNLGQGDDDVGKAWNPVIHFDVPLAQSYETGEWELRVRLLTRGKLPNAYKQRYAVVLEVIDERSGTDVYQDVLREAGAIFAPVKGQAAA